MKLAVAYDNGAVFPHFDRTQTFKLYTIQDEMIMGAEIVPTDGSGYGALAGRGVDTLICGGIAPEARQSLTRAGIRVFSGVTGSADTAAAALLAGTLSHDVEASPPSGTAGGGDHRPAGSEQARPSQADIARVKSLGFLRDERTADRFNGRVILPSGKLTAEETHAIAEAAQRFGSGELVLTARLSIDVQGVPFGQIGPMRAFLARHGLETGGVDPEAGPKEEL